MPLRRSHYASFGPGVLALGAALTLQWAGLVGAAWVVGRETMGRGGATVSPPPMRLITRTVASARADTRVMAPPPGPQPSPDRHEARYPATATVVRRGPPPGAAADPGLDRQGYRFYDAKEVDITAEPVSQWNIDPAALDALATSRIVFTLYVGSDGSVLRCNVEEPERLSPEQRTSLAARLAETAMRPARRAGEAVPSRRRVEIFTVGGT